MSEKVHLKISTAVGSFIGANANVDQKLDAIAAASGMAAPDRVMLCFCLMADDDQRVKETARGAFVKLPEKDLHGIISVEGAHPAILDYVARFHHAKTGIAGALLACPQLSAKARQFLEQKVVGMVAGSQERAVGTEVEDAEPAPEVQTCPEPSGDPEEVAEDEAEAGESGEEYLSKYKQAQSMGIAEKIKIALTGDKEWRAILVKDANKLVSSGVIKNPRITEGEVLTILKAGIQNDDILRLICANREWIKNYKIRKALVENPKTPLPSALRFLASMTDKDIAGYAKSKNISSVLATQAKRILLAKQK